MRYVSHTPAPAFALAALPLALTSGPVRALLLTLVLCLALRFGRGPLSSPGALALVFDLTLALLAGLSLGAQWEERRTPLGRRLRAWTLVAGLASALALSVAAAALGPCARSSRARWACSPWASSCTAATASARERRCGPACSCCP